MPATYYIHLGLQWKVGDHTILHQWTLISGLIQITFGRGNQNSRVTCNQNSRVTCTWHWQKYVHSDDSLFLYNIQNNSIS